MFSSIQRLNNLTSLATTYVMVLLGLVSVVSFLTLPEVVPGQIDIKDLVMKGRLRYWGAREEELGSLRFDVRADLQPLLTSYNTKQLFLYMTATYSEPDQSTEHEVVLWDRIITRGDVHDFRQVGKKTKKPKASAPKKGRGKVRVEEGKNKYPWKNPSGTFRTIDSANITLHYSLMPYVGILSSGVAATASGPITIPEVKR